MRRKCFWSMISTSNSSYPFVKQVGNSEKCNKSSNLMVVATLLTYRSCLTGDLSLQFSPSQDLKTGCYLIRLPAARETEVKVELCMAGRLQRCAVTTYSYCAQYVKPYMLVLSDHQGKSGDK